MIKMISTLFKLVGVFAVCVILSQAPIKGRPISSYFRQVINHPFVQKTAHWVHSRVDMREHFADKVHAGKLSGLLKKKAPAPSEGQGMDQLDEDTAAIDDGALETGETDQHE